MKNQCPMKSTNFTKPTLALKYSKKEITDAQFEKHCLKEMKNKLGFFWPQFELA